MKAVLITESNRDYLASRYNLDVEAFPVGYIMVAEWGDDGRFRYQGILTQEKFDELFVKGKTLANEFFEIHPKEQP